MKSFAELPLLEPLQRAVREEGYTVPTPIQAQSIIPLLEGKDLLGCAQTGTGKTAAFTLPLLQKLATPKVQAMRNAPRALILAPTRELAAQIRESIRTYGKYLHITSTVIFGGVGQQNQVNAINRGVDILVATPGRLLDLIGQGHLRLNRVEFFVLDEADRMLDMGFIHDIRKIILKLPAKRQSLFFSATLEPKVIALAKTLVHDPVHVSVTPETPTVEKTVQSVYFVDGHKKDMLLVKLVSDPAFKRVIVFTQMKHIANKVAAMLTQAGIRAEAIHGNKSQTARIATLEAFRRGKVHVLVATDLAARGIDVDGITQVINYELPNEPETYIHRIGRTARAGAEGQAISFCSASERGILHAIERLIHKQITVVHGHEFHSEAAMNSTCTSARSFRPNSRGRRSGFGGQGGSGHHFGRRSGEKRSSGARFKRRY
ncbi:MAG TPA: DEAD/DEAH box helicase [Candidatus Nanoarchaeia archaeon]|nr:DEAD/DEAH box helicase [Candidatus Nanoarchaeia archaeon]